MRDSLSLSLRRRLCAVFLLFCLLSFADNIFLHSRHPQADFYLPLSRFWELLAGAVLQAWGATAGQAGKGGSPASRVAPAAVALAGIALLVLALFRCEFSRGAYPGWMAVLPVASAFLLIAAGPQNALNRLLLANPASVFLGKISYTFYLWHWPLLSFAWLTLGGPANSEAHALRACLVGLALALAALTWRFVEVPVRAGTFLGKYKVPVLLAAMFLVGLAGLAVWRSDGLVLFMGPEHRAVAAQLARPPQFEEAALEKLGLRKDDLELARFTDAGAARTIAIVGDSHAQSAYPGIARLGREAGFNTLLLGRFPGSRKLYYDSTGQPARILDILARHGDIEDVLLMIRGAGYTAKVQNPGDRSTDRPANKRPDEFYAEVAAFVKKLTAFGKNVIIVEDNPDLDIDVRDALAPVLTGRPVREDYGQTRKADALARQKTWLGILDRLAQIPGVTILRGTLDAFCPGETCQVFTQNGLPLYFDDDHLSQAGSDKLAREVIAPWWARKNFPARGTAREEPEEGGHEAPRGADAY